MRQVAKPEGIPLRGKMLEACKVMLTQKDRDKLFALAKLRNVTVERIAHDAVKEVVFSAWMNGLV